jgi:hypothetical protein
MADDTGGGAVRGARSRAPVRQPLAARLKEGPWLESGRPLARWGLG